MKRIYNIKLLKPLGYISIHYAEKIPTTKPILSEKEDLERTMFNEEKINILEVLNEKEQLQNNWNELKKWLEEVIKDIGKFEVPNEDEIYKRQILKNILSKIQVLEEKSE